MIQRKVWFYGGTAVVLLVALLAWAFAPRPVQVELAAVTQGRFETGIEEDAKTRLADRYVVSAPLAGRLARITLREGDAVAAGSLVATLMPALPGMLDERTLRELQARVDGAQANIARAATRIARANVAVQQAVNEVRRSEQLAQQGFISPNKLENDRLGVAASQREADSAVADRNIASFDLAQARAALGAVRQPASGTAAGFAVNAPIAGRVLRLLQTSEVMVAMGTPLLEIGDTQRLEIVTELLTTDALAARPGSRVAIDRWGGPGTLEGRVRSVEPAAFTKVSALGVEEQRVRVLIELTSPAAQWQALGDGFRVSVRIVTLAQDKAVQVPVSAVFPLPVEKKGGGDANGANDSALPRFAVFVAEGGRARQVPVVLAARNGSAAWVQSGLVAGQQVIVYPPSTVSDGVRVAARKI